MIGVPPLHDGSSLFQTMFSFFSRLQLVGRFLESLIPLPVGPRHCGQLSFAVADSASPEATRQKMRDKRQATITIRSSRSKHAVKVGDKYRDWDFSHHGRFWRLSPVG